MGGVLMKLAALFCLFVLAAAANYPGQRSVLLDVGSSSITISNSGSAGGTVTQKSGSGANQRVRVTIANIDVPPPSDTSYSACADPCTVSINRNLGQQYYWSEIVDNSGNPLRPRRQSQRQILARVEPAWGFLEPSPAGKPQSSSVAVAVATDALELLVSKPSIRRTILQG
jgi:hypothetical protein